MSTNNDERHISSSPTWDNPKIEGHKLEGNIYTSKEVLQKELDYLWPNVWLLMGRADEIPDTGDYQTEELGKESFIMVRQNDLSIKTFFNVCQHRGARLAHNPIGFNEAFKCPYHGWTWELDGTLSHAQDSEDFPEGNPCGKLTLQEAKTEIFAGFIWINMNPECKPLKEELGPVWDDWKAYEIHNWKRYQAQTVNLPCNWKLVLDNFNESYHVPTVHAPLGTEAEKKRMASGVDTDYKNTQFDLSNQGHNRMIMKGGYAKGIAELPGGEIGEPLASVMKEWSLNPKDFKGKGLETREALQKAKRKIGKVKGYSHYDNLRDEQLTDAFHYTLFPNFAVSLWADGFHFLRARPHATDPERCVFDNWWYSSQPEHETAPVRTTVGIVEREEEVEHDVFELGEKSCGVTIDGDIAMFQIQQMGVKSSAYKGAYLSGQESRVSRFHEMIDNFIEKYSKD